MKKENYEKTVAFRHTLHELAELSGQEKRTIEQLQTWIRENTTAEIVSGEGWFYAAREVGEEAASLVFRADMDAIPVAETIELSYASRTPGVAHKCGHDGHMAGLLGLLLETEEMELGKNLYFLFQPAEETGAGAPCCLPLFDRVKGAQVYGLHNIPGFPRGSVILRRETFACASRGLILHFTGATSHAAYPHFGKNPAPAIAAVIGELSSFTKPEDYQGLILCTIIQVAVGERAFGVSAGEGELLLTIRAEREEELALLQERILAACKGEAEAAGLSFSHEICDAFPETRNDADCVRKLQDCCERLRLPYCYPQEPMRWSEDFGHYLKREKGAFFGIGDGEEHPQLHTQEYDFPDELLETVVDLYRELILG